MKTKITFFLHFFFSVCSFGQVGTIFSSGGLEYFITTATTVSVGANSKSISGAITIPSTVSYNSENYQVTRISDSGFYQCIGLTEVIVPNSVTSIGDQTFADCYSLSSITIGNAVTSIGHEAFYSSTSLTSLNIPDSVTYIGFYAFANSGITSVRIPNSIISLRDGIFNNCRGLTSISIPNSVTSIGKFAFSLCYDLTLVKVNWTTPLSIDRSVFDVLDLSRLKLNVPVGYETAYKNALVWKEFGTITTLGTNHFSVNTPVKFYPNPTQSQINFSQEINNFEVFDIAGRKIKLFQNSSSSFDVSNLNNGIYILRGKSTEGKNIQEKMIKE